MMQQQRYPAIVELAGTLRVIVITIVIFDYSATFHVREAYFVYCTAIT